MKNYEVTYMLNSVKQTLNIESLDEKEAGKKFLKLAPDVPPENVLSVIDLSEKDKSNKKIITYAIVTIIGAILFMNRGFFASLFLNATTIGNMGLRSSDGVKVGTFAIIGGIVFIIGLAFTAIELIRKKKVSK